MAAVLATALLLGCEERTRESAPDPEPPTGPTPTHISWNARFTMSQAGRPRAHIRAEQMEQYDTPDSTYSILRSPSDTSRVRAHVFDEQGDSSAVIIADSVLFHDREGRFEAFGNVVVITTEDKRLESEHLTWQQADRKIRTRRFVRILTPTERVQGNGLVADEDLDTYQIGRFTAEVEMESDST